MHFIYIFFATCAARCSFLLSLWNKNVVIWLKNWRKTKTLKGIYKERKNHDLQWHCNIINQNNWKHWWLFTWKDSPETQNYFLHVVKIIIFYLFCFITVLLPYVYHWSNKLDFHACIKFQIMWKWLYGFLLSL